ncbi:MAG TPA: hypothetical protein VF221_05870, partial [Chloroflexota bacterium]
ADMHMEMEASFMVTRLVVTALLLFGAAAATLADTPTPVHREISKETREKMAQLHEQMAACLRSDKSVQECHSDMVKSCQEQLGDEGCPMMAGPGHRLEGRHRMQPNGNTPE